MSVRTYSIDLAGYCQVTNRLRGQKSISANRRGRGWRAGQLGDVRPMARLHRPAGAEEAGDVTRGQQLALSRDHGFRRQSTITATGYANCSEESGSLGGWGGVLPGGVGIGAVARSPRDRQQPAPSARPHVDATLGKTLVLDLWVSAATFRLLRVYYRVCDALRYQIVALSLLSLVGAAIPTTAAPMQASAPAARSLRVEPVAALPRRLNFTNDILPVLSKAGCNQGSCHGKASGQGGFRLSIFAFDPEADYDAIVKESRGRRVRGGDPDRSLFLLKPTARMPHGGGRRFTVGAPEDRLLRRWIAAGMPFRDDRDPVLERVEISPAERMLGMKQEQQLLATAIFSDGSRRDVTRAAAYSSNEDQIAAVAPGGRIRTADVAGEAAVMVRYMGQIAVSRVTVPYGRPAGGGAGRCERSELHRRTGPEKVGAAADRVLASLHGC